MRWTPPPKGYQEDSGTHVKQLFQRSFKAYPFIPVYEQNKIGYKIIIDNFSSGGKYITVMKLFYKIRKFGVTNNNIFYAMAVILSQFFEN